LKLMPVGSDPPESANVYGGVPPPTVTGVNVGISVLTVPTVDGTACVVENGPLTVSWKVCADTAPAASVTVTVNVVSESAAPGVPEICPVVVLKVTPVGSVPPERAKAYGVVPFAAVTGMNGVRGVPTFPVVLGTACVVVSAALIVRLNVFDAVAPTASVIVIVRTVAPCTAVGVPLIAPVVVFSVRPAGSAPPAVIANAYGVVPPEAVTGVNATIAVFCVPVRLAMDCVATSAALTVRLNVLDVVAPAASVIVIVRTVAACAAVGVPLIAPVVVFNVRPAGSAPPAVIANVYGVVPFAAVTGVNAGIATFTVPIVLGTACVLVSAGLTVSWNVLEETVDAASVTVTVNVVVASAVVGVPAIAPVVVLNVSPVSSVPPESANA
jgi:hypothetical protein